MSTIAAYVEPRNGYAAIAADGVYCAGNEIQSLKYSKMIMLGNSVVASAGYTRVSNLIERLEVTGPEEFIQKLQEVMIMHDVKPHEQTEAHAPGYPNCWFFMSPEGKIYEISQELDLFEIGALPAAVGTGREYAVAAMDSMISLIPDATALQIVMHGLSVASKRDVFSGGQTMLSTSQDPNPRWV